MIRLGRHIGGGAEGSELFQEGWASQLLQGIALSHQLLANIAEAGALTGPGKFESAL